MPIGVNRIRPYMTESVEKYNVGGNLYSISYSDTPKIGAGPRYMVLHTNTNALLGYAPSLTEARMLIDKHVSPEKMVTVRVCQVWRYIDEVKVTVTDNDSDDTIRTKAQELFKLDANGAKLTHQDAEILIKKEIENENSI